MSDAPAVLAVDGGNSKTDLALVARSGELLALVTGPTVSHQQVPIDVGMERLRGLAAEAGSQAGTAGPAGIGVYCLAGADFARDVGLLSRHLGRLGISAAVDVRNDALGALRAGAPSGWGIVLVCGSGVNALGVGPGGHQARLAGIGDLSGDWGGGHGIGLAALGAAVRARDGRGPRTELATAVPAAFGLRRPDALMRAMYDGRTPQRRLAELAPIVFATAAEDPVARAIVDRLADELGTMALAIARRLRVVRREVDVVLAGGVFRTDDRAFHARLRDRIASAMPRARLRRLDAPPVLGAGLLGLDVIGLDDAAQAERTLRLAFAG